MMNRPAAEACADLDLFGVPYSPYPRPRRRVRRDGDLLARTEDVLDTLQSEIAHQVELTRIRLSGVDDAFEVEAALEELDAELSDAVRAARDELGL